MEEIVRLEQITYKYERNTVLKNINFTVHKGDFLAIVGPNGSGKSTLLKLILGLNRLQQGEVYLFGQKISHFSEWEKIGYVSQKANSFNSGFPATVEEVVISGLAKKVGLLRPYTKLHRDKVRAVLALVNMEEYIHQNIGELSGGQQQRVFIARAIVSEPELLILDEPTVGVDVKNVGSFYDLLSNLNKQMGLTLLLVTHDTGTITEKVSHVACLNNSLHFHGLTKDFQLSKERELSGFYGHDVHILTHDH